MRLHAFALWAGLRDERLSSLAIFDLHEMPDLPKHACQDRTVVVLRGLADLAQPEGAQRPAMLLGLADLAPYLSDPNLRHLCLRRSLRSGRLLLLRLLVRKHLGDRQPAHPGHLVGAAQTLQAVDRR